jgi:methyl-accepting chemotaxis protein
VQRNPNPVGQKDRLTTAGTNTAYDTAHKSFHEELSRLANVVRFHDMMLVDATTGDVVYSTFKEPDFASNVFHGAYAQSGLGRVVAKALNPRNGGLAVLEDYSIYAPAGLQPQMFTAYPLASEGPVIGVLVAQLDVTPIDGLLSDNQRWAETGQGRTGETVLVGADRLFRSQSRTLVCSRRWALDQLCSGLRSRMSPAILSPASACSTRASSPSETGSPSTARWPRWSSSTGDQ